MLPAIPPGLTQTLYEIEVKNKNGEVSSHLLRMKEHAGMC